MSKTCYSKFVWLNPTYMLKKNNLGCTRHETNYYNKD